MKRLGLALVFAASWGSALPERALGVEAPEKRAELAASMESLRWMIEDSPERIRSDFSAIEARLAAAPEDPELAELEGALKKLADEVNSRFGLTDASPAVIARARQAREEMLARLRAAPANGPAAAAAAARLPEIEAIMDRAIKDGAFPGGQLGIVYDGQLVYEQSFGALSYEPGTAAVTPQTRYDLASLTKALVTAPAVMKLAEERKLRLDDPVSMHLPAFGSDGGPNDPRKRTTIAQLLDHTSGMKAGVWAQKASGADDLLDQIYRTPLAHAPGTRVYSDLGYVVLGKVVESVSGMTLDAYFERFVAGPLGLARTGFKPSDVSDVAPTELDMEWRMRQIHGTVHDPIADVLGGVAGHAGLFGNAADVARLMATMVASGTKHPGWDSKSPTNSSAGELFSPDSYGHLGYTGGSIWTDPLRKLTVVLLTNRTNPTANATGIRTVRPELHDAVIRSLPSLLPTVESSGAAVGR